MPCSVTINDGTTVAVMDMSLRRFSLAHAPVGGGASILRFLDGGAAIQTRWSKQALTLTGTDNAPSDLLDIDYTQELAVDVERGSDSFSYTCVSVGVQETWDYAQGQANWTLALEEV